MEHDEAWIKRIVPQFFLKSLVTCSLFQLSSSIALRSRSVSVTLDSFSIIRSFRPLQTYIFWKLLPSYRELWTLRDLWCYILLWFDASIICLVLECVIAGFGEIGERDSVFSPKHENLISWILSPGTLNCSAVGVSHTMQNIRFEGQKQITGQSLLGARPGTLHNNGKSGFTKLNNGKFQPVWIVFSL